MHLCEYRDAVRVALAADVRLHPLHAVLNNRAWHPLTLHQLNDAATGCRRCRWLSLLLRIYLHGCDGRAGRSGRSRRRGLRGRQATPRGCLADSPLTTVPLHAHSCGVCWLMRRLNDIHVHGCCLLRQQGLNLRDTCIRMGSTCTCMCST